MIGAIARPTTTNLLLARRMASAVANTGSKTIFPPCTPTQVSSDEKSWPVGPTGREIAALCSIWSESIARLMDESKICREIGRRCTRVITRGLPVFRLGIACRHVRYGFHLLARVKVAIVD